MKKLIVAFVAIAHAAAAVAAQTEGLEAMVAKDLARPVRAGGEEGRPFWNRYSLQFMYPPAFDFKTVEGAVRYRFAVVDDALREHVFEAARPTESLVKKIPLDRLVLETDRTEESAATCLSIASIAAKVAELRCVTLSDLESQTDVNSCLLCPSAGGRKMI